MQRTAVAPLVTHARELESDSSASSNYITSSVRLASTESDSIGVVRAEGRAVNELGRIPILEYHLIGDSDSRWMVERGRFREQLRMLYERGYRPITVSELVDGKIDLPAGRSPVVFTFDDASPSQFSYIERDGHLEVDSNSVVGIWLAFHARHPDWGKKATFCMLPGAAAGRSFFGDKGIEGQKTEWRLKKVRFLAEQGFELCNHTLWHANLANYPDSVVRQQIARGDLAIDSAVAGYHVRTFALPLGVWPRNRELARVGSWRDPKSGREIVYKYDAVLMVSGGPARSPFDPRFDPYRLPRVQVYGNELEKTLEHLERMRYVASGVTPSGRARSAKRPVGD
ncbi:MAG TPA: polysaccharide deacetylase family protein [Gemmatimonadaceae bacterium]|nr:polysaccharide deacetylase family protein [Gemmatimonadaceae bacterium]